MKPDCEPAKKEKKKPSTVKKPDAAPAATTQPVWIE